MGKKQASCKAAHSRFFDNYRNKGRKFTGFYRNGKRHGNWTFWNENGKTDREESYSQGDKSGDWIYYSDDGTKEKLEKYDKGKDFADSSVLMNKVITKINNE